MVGSPGTKGMAEPGCIGHRSSVLVLELDGEGEVLIGERPWHPDLDSDPDAVPRREPGTSKVSQPPPST